MSHARLSPSSASRWIACPGSVRLTEAVRQIVPESTTPWSAEGTQAHEFAAIAAAKALRVTPPDNVDALRARLTTEGVSATSLDEMVRHAEEWGALMFERAAQMTYPVGHVEVRMPTGIKGIYGTADAVIVGAGEMVVADFKYGKGVAVNAVGNAQLRLYALGAVNTFQTLSDIDQVTTLVHQPRLGSVSTETLSVTELKAWRDEVVKPAARAAESDDPPYHPSAETCRFCPALGWCTARASQVLDIEIADATVLDAGALASALDAVEGVDAWAKALRAAAIDRIYSRGEIVDGYKVVAGRSRRSIVDDDRALDALTAAGFDIDAVAPRTVSGVTALDKIVGHQRLAELLGDALASIEGPPSLARASDKRPSITPETQAIFTPYKGE